MGTVLKKDFGGGKRDEMLPESSGPISLNTKWYTSILIEEISFRKSLLRKWWFWVNFILAQKCLDLCMWLSIYLKTLPWFLFYFFSFHFWETRHPNSLQSSILWAHHLFTLYQPSALQFNNPFGVYNNHKRYLTVLYLNSWPCNQPFYAS